MTTLTKDPLVDEIARIQCLGDDLLSEAIIAEDRGDTELRDALQTAAGALILRFRDLNNSMETSE